jgi:hypothetical protein
MTAGRRVVLVFWGGDLPYRRQVETDLSHYQDRALDLMPYGLYCFPVYEVL